MKKALITAHVAYAIELFNIPNIKLLQSLGYEVTVACNFKDRSSLSEEKVKGLTEKLDAMGVEYHHVDFQRNPLKLANIKSFFALKKLLRKKKIDLIHCHTPVGGIITRLAAAPFRKKGTKVIYTAHGFHFFEGAPKKNWLIYYTAEKLCSYLTDVLITINKEDLATAKEKLATKSVFYIPGIGIDTENLGSVTIDKIEKKKELSLPEDSKVVLCVGELSERKNQQTVIKALSLLKTKNTHLLLAGIGEKRQELEILSQSLGVADRVHFLSFRTDIAELCHLADVFAFPSLQEGLPVALMEAMACSKAVVCSKIRGNVDLIDEGLGGYLLSPYDCEGFSERIDTLLCDEETLISMGKYNKDIAKQYDISIVTKLMKGIYS